MRVADYIADFIAERSPRVYGVCGAGAMHLNDAVANHPLIEVVTTHHEQAAAYAAEAEARVTGVPAFVMATAGPGAANTITGVACAYVDSIPMLVVAGQVTTHSMVGNTRLRQLGMNELEMVALMQPITKLAITVSEPFMIRYYLEKAYHLATSGRPGPVFLEIPLDVQAAQIDPSRLKSFNAAETSLPLNDDYVVNQARKLLGLIAESNRPVLLFGNGVRISNSCQTAWAFANRFNIPIITSWGAADLMPDHHCHIGHCGLFGDRASNFAIQNCDLLICIGTRLSAGQIGHAPEMFAPNARKAIVDVDGEEVCKPTAKVDLPIVADAGEFMRAAMRLPGCEVQEHHFKWTMHCQELRDKINKWPKDADESPYELVNSYCFIKQLAQLLDDDAIILTDVGFCFLPTFQSIRLKPGQRLIHSGGVSPMGWGIPAAIGAAFACGQKRPVICLTGDGGAMMNIQELQTISTHNLPITIFVFDNGGYETMKIAQNTHFHREVMAGVDDGVRFPRFSELGKAFGISTMEVNQHQEMRGKIKSALFLGQTSPMLVTLFMESDQVIAPRLVARTENGKFLPVKFDDMWPFIEKLEYQNIEEGSC